MRYRAVLALLGTMVASVVLLATRQGVLGAVHTLSGIALPTARAQQPDPALPAVPVIPPIPEQYTRALPPGLRVVVRDISFDHRRVTLRVPYLEVVGRTDGGVRLSLVHIRGARMVSRQTGVVLPIDPFMKLTQQRIEIGRLRIDDTSIRRQLLNGRTQWYLNDLDLDARNVALGGTAAEGLRIVHADARGAFDDAPLDLRRLSADVRRLDNHLSGNVDVRLAATHARVDGQLTRHGPFSAGVTAETVDFGELHAFAEQLPRTGAGTVRARLSGVKGSTTIALQQADLRVNESTVAARGVIQTGVGGRVQAVVVDIERLLAADLKSAFDVDLPGGGEVRGEVTADGPWGAGVRVNGELHRLAEADSTRLRLNGVVRDSGGLRIDMHAHAEPVRAADTLLIVALHARGPLDTLSVTGDITLAQPQRVANGEAERDASRLHDARAQLDALIINANGARVARGGAIVSATAIERATGEPVTLKGTLDGVVTLAKGGAIDAELRADSLPLRLVPTPSAVREVEGLATGAIRITGTTDEPRWAGAINISDGGLRVRRLETRLERLNGTIRVDNDVVSTDGLVGSLGDGRIELTGSARVRGAARPLDATLRIERGLIVNNDSLRAIASSELRVAGDLTAPRVRGHLTVHNGRFDEDMLKENEPVNLESPPYASIAARVPWIRASRLLPRDTLVADNDADEVEAKRMALDVDVALRVERDFKIVDEDSEMFGVGDIRLLLDSIGLTADGSYRIEGGEYNNFGERFRVLGGFFYFPGQGTLSRVSLRGRHEPGAPLGRDLGTGRNALDFYPPLESFGIGSLNGISEEVRRMALLHEDMTKLGSVLLYRESREPVTQWRARHWWRADAGATVLGPRAGTQLFPLLWAYTADETYDLIPLSHAYLRASTIEVGPMYPGRTVVAGVIGGGLRANAFELDVRQPLKGNAWPGMQLRYATGAWRLSLFNEPRFRALPAAGPASGYTQARRNGVRVLWRTEW